ncbi:unnamed protein product [Periconia digitata]|uniref:proteasome endopeptidase complex n=1 Tax=Periconia digitata TaxID=1303443 RepID=A0A9W4URS7_9PLEO|nr:unnamed protein product [Periconia digitata]
MCQALVDCAHGLLVAHTRVQRCLPAPHHSSQPINPTHRHPSHTRALLILWFLCALPRELRDLSKWPPACWEKVHPVTFGVKLELTCLPCADGIHIDMNHLKKGEVNLGTSIMAINFKDGVILGADSRTTTGAYIANRVTDKLTQVHDTIWCCRSGSAADTQAVADIVHYHLGMYGITNDEPPTTQTAAAIFQELCYANKDQLSAGMIIAGYDHRHGGQVYSIPLGGSLHKQSYAIGGSGSTYIYGYCDANWQENMTEEEGVKFVRGALQEAIKWDGSSGTFSRSTHTTSDDTFWHSKMLSHGAFGSSDNALKLTWLNYTDFGLPPCRWCDPHGGSDGSWRATASVSARPGLHGPGNSIEGGSGTRRQEQQTAPVYT